MAPVLVRMLNHSELIQVFSNSSYRKTRTGQSFVQKFPRPKFLNHFFYLWLADCLGDLGGVRSFARSDAEFGRFVADFGPNSGDRFCSGLSDKPNLTMTNVLVAVAAREI